MLNDTLIPLTDIDHADEMLDCFFERIEKMMDRAIVEADPEAFYDYPGLSPAALAGMSVGDKISHVLGEGGIEAVDEESGSRLLWQWIWDLVGLRADLERNPDPAIIMQWLESRDMYETENEAMRNAPEPLKSELLLYSMLCGCYYFLRGWFDPDIDDDDN